MKEHLYRFIGAVFLTILALMGIGAVLHILLTLPFEGKGPEWVGAIGTVATLIGTIWLATASERKRRGEQLDMALVTAAELTLWITNLRSALLTAKANLPGSFGAPDDPQTAAAECLSVIEAVGIWGKEDFAALVHLPHHIAARLAWTTTKVRSVVGAFRQVSDAQRIQAGKLLSFQIIMDTQLGICASELEAHENELITFLGNHGFAGGIML